MTAATDFDLVVIGGGIHGVCLTYEATLRGLRPLLLEAREFGAATSANSMGILHGGFRYLQTADLRRFRISIRERRWFCRQFPHLVRPLPCLMPLYRAGVRRPGIMRVALGLNNLLSHDRNEGLPQAVTLPESRILGRDEVATVFPAVRGGGLRAGALWYDAFMPDAEAVTAAVLQLAESAGATAYSRHVVRSLLHRAGRVTGVEAEDRDGSRSVAFHAPVVVNCAGPWSEGVAAALGSPASLFTPTLAFNLLLDQTPPAEAGLAVQPPAGGPTYFILPCHGMTLAGTGQFPWRGAVADPVPSPEQIATVLADLNASVPGLELRRSAVVRVMAGLVPARSATDATPATRDTVIDHAAMGGPAGLYSAVTVKYTTARHTADQVLRRIYRDPRALSELASARRRLTPTAS